MAFPEDMHVSRGFKKIVVTHVRSFFGFESSEAEAKSETLQVLSSYDMRAQCLLLYLDNYRHILLSEFSDEMTLSKVVNDVHLIFDSLIKVKVTYQSKPDANYSPQSVATRDTHLMKKVPSNLCMCIQLIAYMFYCSFFWTGFSRVLSIFTLYLLRNNFRCQRA